MINFLKYCERMHFKHKRMDCNRKIRGHYASKFCIIYSNGGHIGFNYTHTSLRKMCVKYKSRPMNISCKITISWIFPAYLVILCCGCCVLVMMLLPPPDAIRVAWPNTITGTPDWSIIWPLSPVYRIKSNKMLYIYFMSSEIGWNNKYYK